MPSPREKLQQLLRELFQFGSADLDFGIYRIMNFKRNAIERFIKEDLIEAVDKELSSGMLASQSQAALELKEVAAQICETLGETALNGDGSLDEAYKGTPLGKRYLELQTRASQAQERPALEAIIFNHLYTFFSRYYDNGDFLSKRRYSRREKYAIPYNGEEVYLHWANNDQYYVKTGEYFNDYRFKSPYGISVHFMLVAADVEKDNVKGDKRFFVPIPHEVTFDAEKKEITIPFQYRSLTEQEEIKYGQRNQQDIITKESLITIPAKLEKDVATLPALLITHHTTSDGQQVNYLEHHLRQYTRRNTSDFFVHKDLKGFLTRELDFYLKNEVLNLDEMEAGGEARSEAWFQIMRVIKSIGSRVIEFLAQIEDFQKRLFEKRKFILETQYCITVANVPDDFYAEIAECEAQWQEWKELFHLDEEQPNLFTSAAKSKKERRIATLKEQPTLVIDTKHFGQQFRDRLLASYDSLDEVTDGLLVHGENFQALNLLLEKYREKVDCVYIDPPYNAKTSEILYKNDFKHSSWLTLMANRLELGSKSLRQDGVQIIAIDENEQERLGVLLNKLFPMKARTCVTIVHNPSGQQGDNFSYCHDYAYFIYPFPGRYISMQTRDEAEDKRNFRDVTGEDSLRIAAANCFYPILIKEGKIIGFGGVCDNSFHPEGPNKLREDGVIEVYPIDPQGIERKWRYARQTVESIADELSVKYITSRSVWDIQRTKNRFNHKTVWTGARYSGNNHGTQLLNHIMGSRDAFLYPKSLYTVLDSVSAGLNGDSTAQILDYFAGSGTTAHAVINLNREDNGKRKFILVEIGDYFDTVLTPRIKKVTFTPEWKDGKPIRPASAEEGERSPRIVKYIRLESYEDALNNITFPDVPKTLYDFDDYLLKYMLAWETKESETLLNVEKLASPFSYKLIITGGEEFQEKLVDIPETFAYLLGLNVKNRRVYQDEERYYLVYRGNIDYRETAVIWRETSGWEKADYERDKQFVEEQKLTEGVDEVFVNGDSYIPKARALESVFKNRMFGSL